jgi:hypothetical protein
VENAGVSGAGGRFTAVWGAEAVENTAAGAGLVVAETGVDVPAPLKATGAAGVFGLGAACCAAAGCENPARGTGPAGAGAGEAGDGALLNAGAVLLPAG